MTTARTPDEPVSRDARVTVRVDPVGYPADGAKHCVLPATDPTPFEVVGLPEREAVYRDDAVPAGGDFGDYAIGRFDGVSDPGTYYVRTDGARSYPFRIGEDPYDELGAAIVSYFGAQRCGPSATGYLSPCHCDDGVRADTGEHQDATGGWHDACGVRKWVDATVYALVGLNGLLERGVPAAVDRERVLDELRWGYRYFLSMQEPAGYLMAHVGGDLLAHGDGVRWTDNVVQGDAADEAPRLVESETARREDIGPVAVCGSGDDRVIETEPASPVTQYTFAAEAARTARAVEDSGVRDRYLDAATDCFEWCIESGMGLDPREIAPGEQSHRAFECVPAGVHGALIRAAVHLYRATDEPGYRERAVAAAERLRSMQARGGDADGNGEVGGYFHEALGDPTPYRQIWTGPMPFLGLCALAETLPDHDDAPAWRGAIDRYANGYLTAIADRNAFGVVPYGLYADDPGGGRPLGPQWYRYTMHPRQDWWVGVNGNVASAGVGLARAARLLDDPGLTALAGRQLDWILGSNPPGASTVLGFGYDHVDRYVPTSYDPPVPHIRGAVMNGLGGTADDEIARNDGDWQTAEYWTPMCAYTLWLTAELGGKPRG